MDGSQKRRTRKHTRDEEKMIEKIGGESVIIAILRGETPEGFPPVDPELKRRFPFSLANYSKPIIAPDPFDYVVPPHRQMWNKKEFSQSALKRVDRHMKKYYLDRLNTITNTSTQDEEKEEELSDYEYPNIDVFMDLDESERVNSKDFQRDMARYIRDEKLSDGFDVGLYPYRDAAGICGSNFLFCYYKPPAVFLPKPNLNTLVHLSQLAISVYNMHQLQPTHYDNVQVLKAIKFGPYGTHLNLTFQASFPPVTFQTRLYDHCYPPFSPYYDFEIVLVRKFNIQSLSPQETDYVGVEWLPKFPLSMEKLSDFNEKDPQTYTLHTDIRCKLPLYLSQFALHQYNLDHKDDEDDDIYDNVKVLSTMKSLNDEQGTTYFITFEACNSKNPQTFETKLFMSPLLPTTRIKFWFVRIKPN